MKTSTNSPASLAEQAQQATALLEKVSAQLKEQRRHFDDAVVTHCIHLIQEYLDGRMPEAGADMSSSNNPDGRVS